MKFCEYPKLTTKRQKTQWWEEMKNKGFVTEEQYTKEVKKISNEVILDRIEKIKLFAVISGGM